MMKGCSGSSSFFRPSTLSAIVSNRKRRQKTANRHPKNTETAVAEQLPKGRASRAVCTAPASFFSICPQRERASIICINNTRCQYAQATKCVGYKVLLLAACCRLRFRLAVLTFPSLEPLYLCRSDGTFP